MVEFVVDIILLVAFLAILVRSASFAIEHLVRFTKITGISALAAGFVLLSVATSTPEIGVAVFSVQSDNVGITLGNLFGANITNVTLVAGLFILLAPIARMHEQTVKSLAPILLCASLIPLLLLLAQEGSRFIGIALLGVFSYFVYHTFKSKHEEEDKKKELGSPYKPLLFFLIGISIVIVSAKMVVDSASSIAEYTGIAESALGATIISIGTTLPELSVNIVAVRKKHLDLAIGNTVGSCLTNISMILGIVLVLSEVAVNFAILSALIAFAIAAPAVLYMFLRKGSVRKWHSIALFAVYAVFLLVIYEIEVIIKDIRFL